MIPDWNEIAKPESSQLLWFVAQDHQQKINEIWNTIVKNPERDNEEVKYMMMRLIESNQRIKIVFNAYLDRTYSDDSTKVNWGANDVLRFMNAVRFANETIAQQ